MSTTTTEMTKKVEQVKVASGFARRNQNKDRIENEEAELADLIEANKNPQDDEDTDSEPVDIHKSRNKNCKYK